MALAAPPSTSPITPAEQRERLAQLLASRSPAPRRILVIGPDITRCYSGAGGLTSLLFELAAGRCHIDLMPALGTHEPMTPAELDRMYPGVPHDRVLVHDWRNDLLRIGEIPAGRIEQLSAGRLHFSIAVEINRRLLEGGYDLILSVGQVVPHEVIGMANHSKNLFIGVGGGELLNKSHYLGAVVGMEQIMGRMNNPVRSVMDDAAAHGLAGLPIVYVQTVIAPDPQGRPALHGLFIGEGRRLRGGRAPQPAPQHHRRRTPAQEVRRLPRTTRVPHHLARQQVR
ncbi:MAG TPA: lactate racemase domain-containing protein, partial [Candidatus Sumerlaeota bacterium]|nr:lactate racemase domain-containing protein [Candidatus Sumerlaeota bacterium]